MARKQSATPKKPVPAILQSDDLTLIRDAKELAERAQGRGHN